MRLRSVSVIAGFVAAGLLVYARSLFNGFVGWDDSLLILENPLVTDPSFAHVFKAFTSYDPELYIPFSLLSYQLTALIAGLNPFAFHLGNLLLHVANALLVTAILQSFVKQRWIAVCAGLLFLLHPIQTEAVAWASARKDVLSAFFTLASIAAFLRSDANRKWYWISAFCFAAALLSKVTPIFLPLALVAMLWGRGTFDGKKTLLRLVPFFALSIIFAVIAAFGKIGNSAFLWEKILIGCRAIALTLQHIIAPYGLSVLYPYTQPISILTPDILLSVIIVIAVTAAAVLLWHRKQWRLPLTAWAIFLLFLLPSFSNIAKGHNELLDVYIGSDRYAYVAVLGALIFVAVSVDHFLSGARMKTTKKTKRMLFGIVGSVGIFGILGILGILGFLSYRQSLTWHDTTSLFSHTLAHYPNSYVAHTNIGTEKIRTGNIDDGLASYRAALAIRDDATTWYNVGQVLLATGDQQGAEDAYRRAFASSPLESDAAAALIEILLQTGRSQEARAVLSSALEAAPDHSALQSLRSVLR